MFILYFMKPGASSVGITSNISFYVSLHNKYLIDWTLFQILDITKNVMHDATRW